MFSHTAEIAKNDIICYVNGDMVFFDDLLRAVQQMKATGISEFLAVGHRYDVDITTEIDFSASWQEEIRKQALEKGERHNDYGIDYFMLPRHLFAKMQMPDFPIGRACWDNWFIYRVRALGVPVISLSNAIVAVHQNHDYSHHPKGRKGVHEGVEVEENLNVAGGRDHLFFLCDVTHELFPGGLQKARPELCTFSRKLRNYGTLHPLSGAPLRLLRKIVLGIKNLLRGTSNES